MSDLFYDALVAVGRPAFFVSSRPTVIDARHADRPGPFIVAATHNSPYDVPILMRHVRRRIDFVSSTEVFQNPFAAWLYGGMNAFPLERSRADPATVRVILDRLRRGRVVGLFPEGGFRLGAASVVRSRTIRPGIGRLAAIADVAVVPCVIVGSERFGRAGSWLPVRRVNYGVAFGEAIWPTPALENDLVEAFVSLHQRLAGGRGLVPSPGRTGRGDRSWLAVGYTVPTVR